MPLKQMQRNVEHRDSN